MGRVSSKKRKSLQLDNEDTASTSSFLSESEDSESSIEHENNYFNEVLNAAKTRNYKRLMEVIKTCSIDVRKISKTDITAAGELASQNKTKQVEFLRLNGANVNNIALGFGIAGNKKFVNKYRKKHNASVNYIAKGLALGGHDKLVEEYRKKHDASVNWIAKGYAQAGNYKMAELYRKEHNASVKRIAQGFAKSGYYKWANDYREEHKVSANDIAKSFAEGGHIASIQKYINKYNPRRKLIAYGLAYGGHYKQALKFSRGSGKCIANGLARGGYSELTEQYCIDNNITIENVLYNIAAGGHYRWVDGLRNEIYERLVHPNKKYYKRVVVDIANGFASSGHYNWLCKYIKHHISGKHSPAKELAKGGHYKWAKLFENKGKSGFLEDILPQYGLDRFFKNKVKYVSMSQMASMFAKGGHYNWAVEYQINYFANKDRIAEGYAEGGHYKWAHRYRKHYNSNIDKIARGFANGKFRGWTTECIYEYGAVVNGKSEIIEALNNKGYTIDNSPEFSDDDLNCPIGYTLMLNPVMLEKDSRFTFEKDNIKEWLNENNYKNPLTREKAKSKTLTPNYDRRIKIIAAINKLGTKSDSSSESNYSYSDNGDSSNRIITESSGYSHQGVRL